VSVHRFEKKCGKQRGASLYGGALPGQKDTPAPAAPSSGQQNRGYCATGDYYTRKEVATKKQRKPAFLLVKSYLHNPAAP